MSIEEIEQQLKLIEGNGQQDNGPSLDYIQNQLDLIAVKDVEGAADREEILMAQRLKRTPTKTYEVGEGPATFMESLTIPGVQVEVRRAQAVGVTGELIPEPVSPDGLTFEQRKQQIERLYKARLALQKSTPQQMARPFWAEDVANSQRDITLQLDDLNKKNSQHYARQRNWLESLVTQKEGVSVPLERPDGITTNIPIQTRTQAAYEFARKNRQFVDDIIGNDKFIAYAQQSFGVGEPEKTGFFEDEVGPREDFINKLRNDPRVRREAEKWAMTTPEFMEQAGSVFKSAWDGYASTIGSSSVGAIGLALQGMGLEGVGQQIIETSDALGLPEGVGRAIAGTVTGDLLVETAEFADQERQRKQDPRKIGDIAQFTKDVSGGIGTTAAFIAVPLLGRTASARLGVTSEKAIDILQKANTLSFSGLASAWGGYSEARRDGATEDQARDAALFSAMTQAPIELVSPLQKWVKRLDPNSQSRIYNGMMRGAQAVIEGGEEALFNELPQTIAGNIVKKYVYNPNQDIFEDAQYSAEVGGAAGLLTSIFTQMIAGRRAKAKRDKGDVEGAEQGDIEFQANQEADQLAPTPETAAAMQMMEISSSIDTLRESIESDKEAIQGFEEGSSDYTGLSLSIREKEAELANLEKRLSEIGSAQQAPVGEKKPAEEKPGVTTREQIETRLQELDKEFDAVAEDDVAGQDRINKEINGLQNQLAQMTAIEQGVEPQGTTPTRQPQPAPSGRATEFGTFYPERPILQAFMKATDKAISSIKSTSKRGQQLKNAIRSAVAKNAGFLAGTNTKVITSQEYDQLTGRESVAADSGTYRAVMLGDQKYLVIPNTDQLAGETIRGEEQAATRDNALDQEARAASKKLEEEMIHLAMFQGIQDEYKGLKKPTLSLQEYAVKRINQIYQEVDRTNPDVLPGVSEVYLGKKGKLDPTTASMEFMRMVVQRVRTGQITEDLNAIRQAEKETFSDKDRGGIIALKNSILNALKFLRNGIARYLGKGTSTKEVKRMENAINNILDEYGIVKGEANYEFKDYSAAQPKEELKTAPTEEASPVTPAATTEATPTPAVSETITPIEAKAGVTPTNADPLGNVRDQFGPRVSGHINDNTPEERILGESQALQRGYPEEFATISAKETILGELSKTATGIRQTLWEHLGDLYHRAATTTDYRNMVGKVDKFIRFSKNPKEFENQIKSNAIYQATIEKYGDNYTTEKFEEVNESAEGRKAMEDASRKIRYMDTAFASMYEKLQAFTPLQAMGRNMAIAFGLRRYDIAERLGKAILSAIESRGDSVVKYGFDYKGVNNLSRSNNQTKQQFDVITKAAEIVKNNPLRSIDAFKQVSDRITDEELLAPIAMMEGQSIEARAGVTPQMDAEYLDAVERGDMETAQRMANEASQANMPYEVYNSKTGEVVWSGTYSQRDTARRVRDRRDIKYGANIFKTRFTKLDSSVKAVDPVTRDDAGNVIPLSERFDVTSPLIARAGTTPEAPKQTREQKVMARITEETIAGINESIKALAPKRDRSGKEYVSRTTLKGKTYPNALLSPHSIGVTLYTMSRTEAGAKALEKALSRNPGKDIYSIAQDIVDNNEASLGREYNLKPDEQYVLANLLLTQFPVILDKIKNSTMSLDRRSQIALEGRTIQGKLTRKVAEGAASGSGILTYSRELRQFGNAGSAILTYKNEITNLTGKLWTQIEGSFNDIANAVRGDRRKSMDNLMNVKKVFQQTLSMVKQANKNPEKVRQAIRKQISRKQNESTRKILLDFCAAQFGTDSDKYANMMVKQTMDYLLAIGMDKKGFSIQDVEKFMYQAFTQAAKSKALEIERAKRPELRQPKKAQRKGKYLEIVKAVIGNDTAYKEFLKNLAAGIRSRYQNESKFQEDFGELFTQLRSNEWSEGLRQQAIKDSAEFLDYKFRDLFGYLGEQRNVKQENVKQHMRMELAPIGASNELIEKFITDVDAYLTEQTEEAMKNALGLMKVPRNAVESISRTGGIATISTKKNHGFKTGDKISVESKDNPSFKAEGVEVTVIDENTFTYKNEGENVESMKDPSGKVGEFGVRPTKLMQEKIKEEAEAQFKLVKGVKDIVKLSSTDEGNFKEGLVSRLITEIGMPEAESAALADYLITELNKATAAQRSQNTKDAIAKAEAILKGEKKITKKAGRSFLQKIIEQANSGQLDSHLVYQALKESHQLPKNFPEYSAEFVDQLREWGDRISKLPEGVIRAIEEEKMARALQEKHQFTAGGLLSAYWYYALLSQVATPTINVLAGVTNLFSNMAIWSAQTKFKSGFPMLRAMYKAMEGKSSPAVNAYLYVMQTGLNPSGIMDANRQTYPKAQAFETGSPDNMPKLVYYLSTFGDGKLNFLPDWLNNGIRAFSPRYLMRRLRATDYFLREVALEVKAQQLGAARFESRGYELAINQARGELVSSEATGKQLEREVIIRANEIYRKQRIQDEKVMASVEESARETVYGQEPQGALGDAARWVNSQLVKRPATQLIIPFSNTVANVTNELMNYLGFGIYRAGKEEFTLGRKDKEAELLIKGYIGFAAFIIPLIIQSLQSGDEEDKEARPFIQIYSEGPRDPKQNAIWSERGGIKYSIRIGETYYSLLSTPLVLPLVVAANTTEEIQRLKKKAGGDILEALKEDPGDAVKTLISVATAPVGIGLQATLNQSFLTGLADLFEVKDTKSPGEWTEGFAKNIVSRLIVPGQLRDLNKLLTDNRAAGKGYLSSYLKEFPVVSQYIGDEVGYFGEDVKYPSALKEDGVGRRAFSLLGRLVSTERPDPVFELMYKKGIVLPSWESSYKWQTGIPMKKSEQQDFRRLAGPLMREEILDRADEIKDMDIDDAQETVDSIINSARKRVKADMQLQNDRIQRLIEKKQL